jgi:archaellum component FlaG (FlaF/FlaG flagellin family)
MKKILICIICVAMAVGVFGACAKKDANDKTTAAAQATTEKMTTDSAVIKEADAINLIESYSDDELGLTAKQRKTASFLVASNGVKIEDGNYIEVIATVKKEHKEGDKTTFTFDNLGVYYIRYDGKKIMRKDMESETPKYIDMKVKAVPSTTAANVIEESKDE